MVNATLKNADIEARGAAKPALGDADVLPILQKMIKQRQESVELYRKGGRDDLVQQEQQEIDIIAGYLPRQMSDDELDYAFAPILSFRHLGFGGLDLLLDEGADLVANFEHVRGHRKVNRHAILPRS